MKKSRLVVLALALAAAGIAQAADKRTSISLFGLVSKSSGQKAFGSVNVGYGYLFTDSIEAEGRVGQTYASGITSTDLGVGVKYYFGGVGQNRTWLPYARLGAQTTRSSGPGADPRSVQLGGGVDLPINEASAVFVEAMYTRTTVSGTNTNGTLLFSGIKIRF